jgi:hypothetical protein
VSNEPVQPQNGLPPAPAVHAHVEPPGFFDDLALARMGAQQFKSHFARATRFHAVRHPGQNDLGQRAFGRCAHSNLEKFPRLPERCLGFRILPAWHSSGLSQERLFKIELLPRRGWHILQSGNERQVPSQLGADKASIPRWRPTGPNRKLEYVPAVNRPTTRCHHPKGGPTGWCKLGPPWAVAKDSRRTNRRGSVHVGPVGMGRTRTD